MKILIVSAYFPPENAIASLRTGAFARYWAAQGHEVHVLCRVPLTPTMPALGLESVEIHAVADPLGRTNLAVATAVTGAKFWRLPYRLLRALKNLLMVPDAFSVWGWLASRSMRQVDWEPDVVVGSGGPLTSLVVADRLSRRYGVPLVVDFRDPLASAEWNTRGPIRRRVDLSLERRIVARAVTAVTVSRGAAKLMESVHARNFLVIYNGYEPDHFRDIDSINPQLSSTDVGLNLVITGTVYPEQSSLGPLFSAMREFRQSNPDVKIALNHYGSPQAFRALHHWAEEYGEAQNLIEHGVVSHEESIRAQLHSDALVFPGWHEHHDFGVLPGKMFEYLGSGRPVIQVGGENGESAEIVRQAPRSIASSDSTKIAQFFDMLLAWKASPSSAAEVVRTDLSYTREIQSLLMLGHLEKLNLG